VTVSEISVQGAISDDISGCRECFPRCKFCNSKFGLNIYSTFDSARIGFLPNGFGNCRLNSTAESEKEGL